jgi:hypothetical protein
VVTSFWEDLLGGTWELVTAGFIGLVLVGIWLGPGEDYSGAPAEDAGEEFDDTAAWDRGHDEWIDREAGVW